MHIVDGLATVIPTNIKCIFIIFYYIVLKMNCSSQFYYLYMFVSQSLTSGVGFYELKTKEAISKDRKIVLQINKSGMYIPIDSIYYYNEIKERARNCLCSRCLMLENVYRNYFCFVQENLSMTFLAQKKNVRKHENWQFCSLIFGYFMLNLQLAELFVQRPQTLYRDFRPYIISWKYS